MKKFLLLVTLAAVGYAVYRQVENERLESDLWTEATAPSEFIPTAEPVDLR